MERREREKGGQTTAERKGYQWRERGEGERESLLACLAEENDSQQSLEPV